MIKQYVNLLQDDDQNFGSRINLEVDTGDVSAEDVVWAEWWVEADGDQNQDQKYLSQSARARLRRTNTRNEDDQFTNRLRLPHVGGDQYLVQCSKRDDRDNAVSLEVIQTWRKLYYTVHYMNEDCRSFLSDLKGKFEDVFKDAFIEFELVIENLALVDEPHTETTNTLNHLYNSTPPLANRPFHLRLVVLNNIYEAENNSYLMNVDDDDYFRFEVSSMILITDKALAPDRPIRSVHARSRNGGGWIDIAEHASVSGSNRIRIAADSNQQIQGFLEDDQEIQVRVRTKERDDYLGHSIGNFCCMRINEPGTPEERKITVLQTLTHEIGHGCQQVVRRERIYNDTGAASGWENNPMWHTDEFGGQGPHCATNAAKQDSEDTTSGEIYAWTAGELCTMFFSAEPHVRANGGFCDACEPRLKRVNLGRRSMRRQGWGLY